MESICEPGRLSIRHSAQFSCCSGLDERLCALNGPDLEAGILRLEQNLVTVEREEGFGCVLTSWSARSLRADSQIIENLLTDFGV